MPKIETFRFFIQGYSSITDKGYCINVFGKQPYKCRRDDVASQSLCEDLCTALSSCIAYEYGYSKYCDLIPSERSCPSGFYSIWGQLGPIAASMNDLKADPSFGWVCYGKI